MTDLELDASFPHVIMFPLCDTHGDDSADLADEVSALAPSSVIYLARRVTARTVCKACRNPVNGTHWHIEARW